MKTRWLVLGVGLAALFVHAPAMRGNFVFHDDYRYVVDNTAIDEIGNPLRFFTDLSTLSTESPTRDIYRPVRTLSYAVLTKLYGKERAAPFHALAIVLHAGTSVLLLLLLRRAGFEGSAATMGALFFAFSPVTAEVTAWVCSLGDAWCGLFVVASMLAYASDRRLLAVLALVLALFSKEHAVVVPGLWLAWDLCVRPERLRAGGRLPGVAVAAAGVAVVLGFLYFRGHVAGARVAQVEEPIGGSYRTAILTMTAGLGWYATTVVFPFEPTFDARVAVRETPFDLGFLLGLLVLAALVYGLVRGSRRVRLGILWLLIALLPVHNVFVPLKIPTADRFLYLPLMGLAFLVAELAGRTYPLSAKWMLPALVPLGLLCDVRIGDWRDNERLLEAGKRVAPKSHRLIWAEAFIAANKAGEYFAAGDFAAGERLAQQAVEHYQLYLRNSEPAEQTQVFVELGNLFTVVGDERARRAPESRREPKSRALEAYVAAFSLQSKGIGRVTEQQRYLVAARIVQLSTELAEPQNPRIADTIRAGLEAAQYRKDAYGIDDTGVRVVLRLADSVRVRGDQPAEARKGFDWVLATLDELEAKGPRFPFIRAQALFYRSILRDRDFDRGGLETAFRIYEEAATDRSVRLRALAYSGRCACTIGSLFRDPQWTTLGKDRLAAIAQVAAKEGLRLDDELKNEIRALEAGCGD